MIQGGIVMYLRLLWDLYKLKRNSLKNSAQIKKLQQKKLKKLLHYAYENSEYYQMAFKRAGISFSICSANNFIAEGYPITIFG